MTTSYTCSSYSSSSRDGTAFYYYVATRNIKTTSYTCSIAT